MAGSNGELSNQIFRILEEWEAVLQETMKHRKYYNNYSKYSNLMI